jgi:hypothetical protein
MKLAIATAALCAAICISTAMSAPAADACVAAAEDLSSLKSVMDQLRQKLSANPSPRVCQSGKKGIAMTIGNQRHVDNAYSSLTTLREEHKSTMPVTIFHWGDEVTAEVMKVFETKFGAKFVDLQAQEFALPHKCAEKKSKPSGFPLKAMAVYYAQSQFEHMLWLDVDNTLLVAPEALFESEEYKTSGSTFWPDFMQGWVNDEIYEVLTEGKHTPAQVADTESGQFLLNTCQHQDVLEYMQALNENTDVVYDQMYGDKDTYRLAFALAGKLDKFHQVATMPGAGWTTVAGSSELQMIRAEAAMANNDLLDVGEFATRCEVPQPALLIGMMQNSPTGKPLFYHRTNAEFSLKNMDQIRTEFVIAPRSAKESRELLWQIPYPSQCWALCPEEATALQTPAMVVTIEAAAERNLLTLREEILSGALDTYTEMEDGHQSEIVRAMQITESIMRRTGNSTNTTTTSAPTAAPTAATTIVQVITATYTETATEYNALSGSGDAKELSEIAYGSALGIATIASSGATWEAGCSVSSSAASARRSNSLAVTYTAGVSTAKASTAETAARTITPASFSTSLTTVQSTVTSLSSVSVPTGITVADPTVTDNNATPAPTSTSGASSSTTVSILALGVVLMAFNRQ